MPVVNGWDFLSKFKEIKGTLSKQVAIMVVSSSDHPRDINQANSFEEVMAYVTKPVSLERLKELLVRS